ncbi:hypothetical protein LTS14_009325 [Recurvomyces mirabilis]|nr:hypothetical protein LTS14_009325 [Recurvomyces mirabilis]
MSDLKPTTSLLTCDGNNETAEPHSSRKGKADLTSSSSGTSKAAHASTLRAPTTEGDNIPSEVTANPPPSPPEAGSPSFTAHSFDFSPAIAHINAMTPSQLADFTANGSLAIYCTFDRTARGDLTDGLMIWFRFLVNKTLFLQNSTTRYADKRLVYILHSGYIPSLAKKSDWIRGMWSEIKTILDKSSIATYACSQSLPHQEFQKIQIARQYGLDSQEWQRGGRVASEEEKDVYQRLKDLLEGEEAVMLVTRRKKEDLEMHVRDDLEPNEVATMETHLQELMERLEAEEGAVWEAKCALFQKSVEIRRGARQ